MKIENNVLEVAQSFANLIDTKVLVSMPIKRDGSSLSLRLNITEVSHQPVAVKCNGKDLSISKHYVVSLDKYQFNEDFTKEEIIDSESELLSGFSELMEAVNYIAQHMVRM